MAALVGGLRDAVDGLVFFVSGSPLEKVVPISIRSGGPLYQAEITRNNPTCFLFLIDQSGSMGERMPDLGESKAHYVATTINRAIQEIAYRCAKGDGIRDYFHLAVLGYGETVQSALGGRFSMEDVVPISEIAEHPLKIESRIKKVPDGAGGVIEVSSKFPIWVKPVCSGATPMCQALKEATRIAANWVRRYPACYPPVVLNLTDGQATDGHIEAPALALTSVASADGPVLLFNLHVSQVKGKAVLYPKDDSSLKDEYGKLLFRTSSRIPPGMQIVASGDGLVLDDQSRGFVFNADATDIVTFLDIGTRATRQVR